MKRLLLSTALVALPLVAGAAAPAEAFTIVIGQPRVVVHSAPAPVYVPAPRPERREIEERVVEVHERRIEAPRHVVREVRYVPAPPRREVRRVETVRYVEVDRGYDRHDDRGHR